MTTGFLRDPTPGVARSGLEAFAYRVATTEKVAARLLKNAPARRQVPIFRIDDMVTVANADGTLDVFGMMPTGNPLSVLLDLVVDDGVYVTVTLRDDLGHITSTAFGPGGTYTQQIDTQRVAVGLLTVAATISAGTGTAKLHGRVGYG